MNEPGLFTADYRSEPGRVEGWRGTPSFEDSELLEQVDDSGLVTLDPTSHGDDQERPGLDRRAHDGAF